MYNQEQSIELIPNLEQFKYLEMGYAFGEDGFSRNHFGTREMIDKMRKSRDNVGLYRTSFWYDSTDPYTANLFSDFYMDFDSEDDIEKARQDLLFVIWRLNLKTGFNLPMEAFHIFFSGKKGFHLIIPWQYLGIEPDKNLDKYFRWLAEDLRDETEYRTVDLVVYERRRLFRLEYSIHQDTGLYKIPLNYHEASTYTIEAIQDLAKQPRALKYPEPCLVPEAHHAYGKYIEEYKEYLKVKSKIKPKGTLVIPGNIPAVVKEVIERGPVNGLRNETVAALSSFWKNQGLSEEDVWSNLVEWSDGVYSETEMKNTMQSVFRRDLNYGLSRFEALANGELGGEHNEREAYKSYKQRGYFK